MGAHWGRTYLIVSITFFTSKIVGAPKTLNKCQKPPWRCLGLSNVRMLVQLHGGKLEILGAQGLLGAHHW